MKNTYIISFLFMVLLGSFSACNTDELTDLNINPNAVNQVDMSFLLAQAILVNQTDANGAGGLEVTTSGFIQLIAAVTGNFIFGDKYFERAEFTQSFFSNSYTDPLVLLNEVITNTKDDKDQEDIYAIARIMRVLVMHRVTDLWGDVPYFNAGEGFNGSVFLPEYDKQELIYPDMFKELEESTAILAGITELRNPDQDIVFGGDVSKWTKFANSLMLRLAMRMSNVDESNAVAWVKKAIAGGVMTSNGDNAMVRHFDGPDEQNRNPRYQAHENTQGQKLSVTLVEWLMNNNDPRLMVYSGGIGPDEGPFDMDPANQNGMPSGYDLITIKEYEGTTEDVNFNLTYSRINDGLIGRETPGIMLVYGEVELLQAEAAQKGWISSDAATHYDAGVIAAMTFYDVFDLDTYVSLGDAQAYLVANPYVAANGLEMIGTQYWALNFTNFTEAFSNWRRTGFPTLTAVDYDDSKTADAIPRRLMYSISESADNGSNLLSAIKSQGPDTFETKIWWDN